ncbi:MAG TPA: hypothetical protein VGD37_18830 [Kofleriaceae bacterium]
MARSKRRIQPTEIHEHLDCLHVLLALGAAALSACVANPDPGDQAGVASAKGDGLDVDTVILERAITAASGPNVSSPWITIQSG